MVDNIIIVDNNKHIKLIITKDDITMTGDIKALLPDTEYFKTLKLSKKHKEFKNIKDTYLKKSKVILNDITKTS